MTLMVSLLYGVMAINNARGGKKIYKELLPIVWHHTLYKDWFVPDDEKARVRKKFTQESARCAHAA